jgi:hypothetical protein
MSEIDPQDSSLLLLSQNVRDNLTATLNRLVRDEIAHVDRRGGYVVDNVTISQVEARLIAALRPRALRAARYGMDGANGPRAYYSDAALAKARRRRPTALERYLAAETAGDDGGGAEG